jgi:hypothetical protein
MTKIKILLSICLGAGLSAFAAMSVVAAPPSNPPNFPSLQATTTPNVVLSPSVTNTITATVTTTATLSPGNEKIANAIADYFGVDVGDVTDIHEQLPGWGQVFFVFALAQTTGETPDEILALREEGEGWGQIIMGLGLKPGNKGNNLGAAVSGKATPTLVPASSSSNTSTDVNSDNCKGNPNNKGKGNPCTSTDATPVPSSPKSNGNSNGNGNGNGKGKGPK